MTLDGSYLKQNSTPLLYLLQETSMHTIEGSRKNSHNAPHYSLPPETEDMEGDG